MSKLPNIDTILIPQKKIVNYLLSETHEAGRDKANFFKRFGCTTEAWEILAQALRQHAARHEIAKVEPSPFGNRYVIVRFPPNTEWESASSSCSLVH